MNGLPVRLVADDSNLKVLHQEKVAFEMHLAHTAAATDVQNLRFSRLLQKKE